MYNAYFVNVVTGEILMTSNPKDNPCNVHYPSYNVQGWSQIDGDFFELLFKVNGFGFVEGIRNK